MRPELVVAAEDAPASRLFNQPQLGTATPLNYRLPSALQAAVTTPVLEDEFGATVVPALELDMFQPRLLSSTSRDAPSPRSQRPLVVFLEPVTNR